MTLFQTKKELERRLKESGFEYQTFYVRFAPWLTLVGSGNGFDSENPHTDEVVVNVSRGGRFVGLIRISDRPDDEWIRRFPDVRPTASINPAVPGEVDAVMSALTS